MDEPMKQTKEILSFLFSVHEGVTSAQADGKIDFADVGLLIDPLMKLIPAVQDAQGALTELKTLTPEEKNQLSAWVAAEYDIPNDELEAKVEKAISLAVELVSFVGSVKG